MVNNDLFYDLFFLKKLCCKILFPLINIEPQLLRSSHFPMERTALLKSLPLLHFPQMLHSAGSFWPVSGPLGYFYNCSGFACGVNLGVYWPFPLSPCLGALNICAFLVLRSHHWSAESTSFWKHLWCFPWQRGLWGHSGGVRPFSELSASVCPALMRTTNQHNWLPFLFWVFDCPTSNLISSSHRASKITSITLVFRIAIYVCFSWSHDNTGNQILYPEQ